MTASTRATIEEVAAEGLVLMTGLILSWPLMALAAWIWLV